MADIIYGIDFRSRKTAHKVAEGPFDFAALEAEISAALWNNDAGTIGIPVGVPHYHDPKEPA